LKLSYLSPALEEIESGSNAVDIDTINSGTVDLSTINLSTINIDTVGMGTVDMNAVNCSCWTPLLMVSDLLF